MKLLYVVHQFFPECHSGTEQYCLATAREARRRGDDVEILSLEPIYDRQDPPLLVFDLPYDGFRVRRLRHWEGLNPNEILRDYENPVVARMFRDLLQEVDPDAIHFFHLRNLGSDLLEVAHDLGVRSIVNLMDFWYLCPRFTLLRSDGGLCEGPPDGGIGCVSCAYPGLEHTASDDAAVTLARDAATGLQGSLSGGGAAAKLAALLRRPAVQIRRLALADGIVAPSRFLADMFARNGLPRDRMTVVPYGLEKGRVRRSEVDRPRDPLRVAFAGVLSPWKAPHLLVEAVRRIDAELELTIHGRTEEYMFRDYIAGVLAKAEGDPRIRFPGPFSREQLDDVLAATDVLVVPSTWYENTPFVVLEAFEAGVPVIASNLGGLSEVVRDGENGYLFDAGSAESLAAVLRQCIEDPARLRELTVEPGGTIEINYETFRRLYS
ncbi:MAG: glycosyltransferase family 4 protein [Planctomycetes bacterium]|nr:glycosyltransferase family 4 protein [Planctomycetota bacterium]